MTLSFADDTGGFRQKPTLYILSFMLVKNTSSIHSQGSG